MRNLWAKVRAFFAKLVGAATIPVEVANSDTLIATWAEIYRAKAPWLPYSYVTMDAVKRTRTRFTLNMAKVLCSEMAGLVLSEPPEVDAGELVKAVLERELFFDNFKMTTEMQGALGGQALKLYTDGDDAGRKIRLDFVKAMNFIPLSWDNADVLEAAFLDRRVKGNKKYVRVETHRKAPGGYAITSKAFDEDTGIEVPLDTLWPGVESEVTLAISRPLFVYLRNPEANNLDSESPLGISLYANALDTLQIIDITFDSLKTEIVMGRQRVAIPGTMAKGYIDIETGKRKLGFDPTEEAYIKLEGDDAENMKPVDLSGQLRVEPYKQAIQTALDLLSVQTGFSAGYFSFDGLSVKTATEVVAENSKTYKTIQAYRDILDRGLKNLFRAMNELGKLYGIAGATDAEPNLVWNDGVIEDRNSEMAYHRDLVGAKLEDKLSAIMKIHGIDKKAAQDMLDRINKENVTITNAALFGSEA